MIVPGPIMPGVGCAGMVAFGADWRTK